MKKMESESGNARGYLRYLATHLGKYLVTAKNFRKDVDVQGAGGSWAEAPRIYKQILAKPCGPSCGVPGP